MAKGGVSSKVDATNTSKDTSRDTATFMSDILAEISRSMEATKSQDVSVGTQSGTKTQTGGDVSKSDSTSQTFGDITTSGGGSRTKLEVNQAAIDSVMQSIMGNFTGLAKVSQGEKAAGLYNSTAQSSITNDLLTRTIGEIAKLTGTQTTEDIAKVVSQGANSTSASSNVSTTPLVISDMLTKSDTTDTSSTTAKDMSRLLLEEKTTKEEMDMYEYEKQRKASLEAKSRVGI